MIFDRMALMGTGAALVSVLALAGFLKLGEMERAKERDTAISERDKTDQWADSTCKGVRWEGVSSSYIRYDIRTGKPLARDKWGVECADFIQKNQARVDGEAGRLAEALQAQAAEQDAKYRADLAAFRRNAARQSTSLKALEAADAAITDGHYPYNWWVRLGDTLGLRERAADAPAPAEPGPAGGGDQGAAPR